MFISQIIGYPFFGIGDSLEEAITDAIVKVHNEDPTSLHIDREVLSVAHGQNMHRVRVSMESRINELSLLMNTKEVI